MLLLLILQSNLLKVLECTLFHLLLISSALNHIMKSVDVESSYEDTLHCLIDPLKTEAPVTNFYGLEPLLKQCKDSAYFATFARYFIMLVASLPAAVRPDWLVSYFSYFFIIESV